MAPIMNVTIISSDRLNAPPVTLSFPIEDYADTYEKLAAIDAGGVLDSDCYIERMESGYACLSALEGSEVNVDELDYLAKRLDSFWEPEALQFEGAAAAKGISGIEDFINLTFCCGQATVIDNFSDLKAIGKAHQMNKNGGSISMSELETTDFERVALDLINNETGQITPHGVVYLNGMELERLYQGRVFPPYLYKECVLVVNARDNSNPEAPATELCLPTPQICMERALVRGGLEAGDVRMEVESLSVSSDLFRWIDWNAETLDSLNELASAVAVLDEKELTALCVAAEHIEPGSAEELRELAYEMFPAHTPAEPEEKQPEQGMTMGGL
jgi:hypothetical protein